MLCHLPLFLPLAGLALFAVLPFPVALASPIARLGPTGWHAVHGSIILVGSAMTLWLVRRICLAGREAGCSRYASLPYVGLAVAYTAAFFLILHPEMVLRV